MIKYESIAVGALQVNCYAVYCDKTREGIIIDPGANLSKIKALVESVNMIPVAVVLTHSHFDHSAHAEDVKQIYNAPIVMHEGEKSIFADAYMNLSSVFTNKPITGVADRLVKDGDAIKFGECELRVIHTPGHTDGSMCLFGEGILFSGDTLFYDSHGRTDFPTGDDVTLAISIKRLFAMLDDDVAVNTGHNQSTTIGREKRANYLVRVLLNMAEQF